MPLLLLLIDLPDAYRRALAERFEVVELSVDEIAPDRDVCARARIVWTHGLVGISEAAMQALPRLEIIICQGVGYEHVDVAAARARGIALAYGRGCNSATVADHAMAILLSLLRRVPTYDRFVRQRKWYEVRQMDPILAGKRVGILGLGHIGRLVAQRAQGFDCEIAYHSRRQIDDCAYHYAQTPLALATDCDVLVVCCPGGEATYHAIDAKVLSALGPSGYLVNISRGSVVDNDALVAALSQQQIAGAALDVVDGEPDLPAGLRDLANVVITPHTGGLSTEAFDRLIQQGLANLDAYFSGKALLTPIDTKP